MGLRSRRKVSPRPSSGVGEIPPRKSRLTTRGQTIRRSIFACGLFFVFFAVVAVCVLGALEYSFMQRTQGLLPSARVSAAASKRSNVTGIGNFEVLEIIPHDTKAFTQGLVVVAGRRRGTLHMYEGTGTYGASQVRRLSMSTGRVLDLKMLPVAYFGEGIAHYRVQDQLRLIQLSWKEGTAFEYVLHDSHNSRTSRQLAEPFNTLKFQTTTTEGWGITYADGGLFYVSDGSNYLYVWDAETKQELRKVAVWYERPDMTEPSAIHLLNELEWDPATNTVLANVWKEDVILRIDPATGFVRIIYDLQALFPKPQRPWGTDVLNGIALSYDSSLPVSREAETDTYWVTGKYWPSMYQIRLMDPLT